MPSRSPETMAAIRARRRLEVDLYRAGKSEREVAKALGVSPATVHFDLKAEGVEFRSQTSGLNRGLKTPEHGQKLRAGRQRYLTGVERAKVERGLVDVDELLNRLRRAGLPRSASAIDGHIAAGLLEPEGGLPFAKPRLFTEASIDTFITRLRGYRDKRLTRYNVTGPEQAKFRGQWHRARHKSQAEFGRQAAVIAAGRGERPGPKVKLGADEIDKIRELRASGKTQQQIAFAVGVTRKQVRRVLDT